MEKDLPEKVPKTPEGEMVSKSPVLFTIGQVEELLEKKTRGASDLLVVRDHTSHPFSKRLFNTRVPPRVFARNIEDYTGEGDPDRHINAHNSSLLGRGATPDHYAALFPTTLKEEASTWFYGLPDNSID